MHSRRRRPVAIVFVAALALLIPACSDGDDKSTPASTGPDSPASSAAAVVRVHNLGFKPVSVTIDAGESVRWDFDDGGIPHDVRGDGLRSPNLKKGSWSFRFTRSGTYQYSCTIHPFMKGTVIVE
jgi:plastocyanin